MANLGQAMIPAPAAIAPAAAAAPGATPAAPDLKSQWMQHLSSPAVRAAMLQFGVGMMQPRQAGQTFAGQVGQSIGEGGQAAARVSEAQRLTARDAAAVTQNQAELAQGERRLAQGDRQIELEGERNLAATKQQGIENQFKTEDIAIRRDSQKALDGYYKTIGARQGTAKQQLPPGYKEALDVAKTAAALEDDPMAYFFQQKSIIDQQYGIGGAASPAPAGGVTTTAASAPAAAPAPGEVRDGWTFKGGDPSVQGNWEKVK